MAEIAKEELDNKNKLSTPKSAADFLKEFDSPWSGLARSRRLSVGTQDTIRLLRTHTRETFDQVTSKSMEEALEAAEAGADIVMLDNFVAKDLHIVADVVKGKHPNIIIEASGGITETTMHEYMGPCVDVISRGNLTQGYPCLDFSLKIDPQSDKL